MDTEDDGTRTARSLAAWLGSLSFTDLGTDQATARVVEAVAEWGAAQGWRVYRRAPSVFPLPPPLKGNSVLDVACARPGAPPVAVEVDRSDRQRTVDKLLAEAAAGRIAVWLRWGTGAFTDPPAPVRMVTCAVTARSGAGGRRFDRTATSERPPPRHSAGGPVTGPEPLA